MESLSLCLSSSSPPLKPHKPTLSPSPTPLNTPLSLPSTPLLKKHPPKLTHSLKPHHSIPLLTNILPFTSPLQSFASEISDPTTQIPQRINLESLLVSVDNFFNKYPYFVAGVTFIWLIAIPLAEEYFNKYKYVAALDAFKKLRDDPSAQLLDIRDGKSLGYIGSPNLRILSKDVVQVHFDEADESGFLKRVLEKFADPSSTVICILDNFDGNSLKVAELLFKNGFKEAYAIEGGIRGKKGWQEIQQEFFPPSVHVFPKQKAKKSQQREDNGAASKPDADQIPANASEK